MYIYRIILRWDTCSVYQLSALSVLFSFFFIFLNGCYSTNWYLKTFYGAMLCSVSRFHIFRTCILWRYPFNTCILMLWLIFTFEQVLPWHDSWFVNISNHSVFLPLFILASHTLCSWHVHCCFNEILGLIYKLWVQFCALNIKYQKTKIWS